MKTVGKIWTPEKAGQFCLLHVKEAMETFWSSPQSLLAASFYMQPWILTLQQQINSLLLAFLRNDYIFHKS